MIILWIRKSKKDKLKNGPKNEKDYFQEHDKMMKKFRQSHPEFEVINDRDILTGDGNLLAPVHKVKLSEYVQN
jgi:hypothetical protein